MASARATETTSLLAMKRERSRLLSMTDWLELLREDERPHVEEFERAIWAAVTLLSLAIQATADGLPTASGAQWQAREAVDFVDHCQTDVNTKLALMALRATRT